MAVKVLLQLKGDATGAVDAVDDAEVALGGLGGGVDWNTLGANLARKAGPMVKAGLIGAALAVGDWLAEGLSEKLQAPEGAEAQSSIDTLTTKLDGIRDKILTPLLDAIPPLVEALLPLIDHVSNLVDVLLPPFVSLLDGVIAAFDLVATAITNTLDGIGNVIDSVTTAVDDLTTFLGDVQTAIQDAIDGITGFFADIKDGIDGLLKPIQDAIKPITDLLDDIFGKADQAQAPGTRSGGSFGTQSAPLPQLGGRAGVVNVYTGADPRAVVRALRRYTGDNGDPGGLVRSFRGA